MTHTHQRFAATDQEREPFRADCPACGPTTYTKGPWNWHKMTGEWPVVFCDKGLCADRPVAQVFGPNEGTNQAEETSKANARLIAAAPELYEVLREAWAYLNEPEGFTEEIITLNERIGIALAAAEGREP